MLPTVANGQPAFGLYMRAGETGGLKAIEQKYKQLAGFDVSTLNGRPSFSAGVQSR